jgi:hypothetical protein
MRVYEFNRAKETEKRIGESGVALVTKAMDIGKEMALKTTDPDRHV